MEKHNCAVAISPLPSPLSFTTTFIPYLFEYMCLGEFTCVLLAQDWFDIFENGMATREREIDRARKRKSQPIFGNWNSSDPINCTSRVLGIVYHTAIDYGVRNPCRIPLCIEYTKGYENTKCYAIKMIQTRYTYNINSMSLFNLWI